MFLLLSQMLGSLYFWKNIDILVQHDFFRTIFGKIVKFGPTHDICIYAYAYMHIYAYIHTLKMKVQIFIL